MPEPMLPIESTDKVPWYKAHRKALIFFGAMLAIFVFAKIYGGKHPAHDVKPGQTAAAAQDQKRSQDQELSQLQAALAAEQAKTREMATGPQRGDGKRVKPCKVSELGHIFQDNLGVPLICVQDAGAYWWEQIQAQGQDGSWQDPYQQQTLTGAQQNAITHPATNSAATPNQPHEHKAHDIAVSFSDSTSVEHSGVAAAPDAPRLVPASVPATVETAGNVATEKKDDEDSRHNLQAATGDKYRVRSGTLLPCTEMLRINGALPGHINCLISINIYSPSGQHLLIPQYSLALGKVEKVSSQNQERLFVAFDQIIEPDGYTVTFKDSDGLDQIGQTGLRDKVDHHYVRILGVSVAIAAIGGLSQIGSYNQNSFTPMGQYRAGVTQSLSESSMRILDRFSSILPTFIIREGARNNLYIAANLWLPDYANHTMKGDL